ncbi:MAG: conjugal transfer protein TraL [Pseudoflavonifractor sp.]
MGAFGTMPLVRVLPCAGGGAVLLAMAAVKAAGLDRGSGWAVALCLVLLALLALGILLRYEPCPLVCLCLLPIGLALFLRALCMDHITYDYMDFLSQWAAFFRENGGFAALNQPIGDYNVPYLYFLAAISYLKMPDLYAIKLFSMLFDVLLAWGGLRLARVFCPPDSAKPAIAFCLLLLLPTVILNGSFWAQCDALYGALTLHALACGLDHRPKASVVLLALAFSFKLQTIFLLPLWCILWYTKRVKFTHLLLFPAAFFAVTVPALLAGRPLGTILGVYFRQTEQYSNQLTLNAPSLFTFIPSGMEVNVPLFSRLGILAAATLVLALLARLFFRRKSVTDAQLLTAAVILAVGVPLLLPSMHERYFFLADTLTVVWACINFRRAPSAVAVQLASLSAYCTYLRLQYTLPLKIGPYYFVMGLEALLLLLVLVRACFLLGKQRNTK